MNEGRCDERLKVELRNLHTSHTLGCMTKQLEIPRDKDEVNNREIHEYDGRTHDTDTMVSPLTPKSILKAEVFLMLKNLLLIKKVRVKDKNYIYVCRCDERLKTKSEKSTRLSYTGLIGELEHLKIETRLLDEMFFSVMGEYVFLK
jgi:hypothetical protein